METMSSSEAETMSIEEQKEPPQAVVENNLIKERKISWAELRRVDSLNLKAGKFSPTGSHSSKLSWKATLSFAFQSIGIVYGDIGTSPLYVFATTFTEGIKNKDDILGVLSLIIYTIVLIPMLKYVCIALWANDNGNGGAFALYSMICRHVKESLIPNQGPKDRKLSNYGLETASNQLKRAQKIKHKLENSKFAKVMLLLVTIMGTSMEIGDSILTPSISVLSAVSGMSSSLGQDAGVGITVAILVTLYGVQHFGTNKVGFSFAPIIILWFSLIGGIGLYNLFKYDIGALRAFNPKYIVDYFKRNGRQGWISLGGIFLCIIGFEAKFADLDHFSVRAIQDEIVMTHLRACNWYVELLGVIAYQAFLNTANAMICMQICFSFEKNISFSCVTFPALLAAYSGQAAYLRKFPEKVSNAFYECIPSPLYWPTFVIAIVVAIIASQAMISGAFSIISQARNLGCFPRVKVMPTSTKHQGQVYIPEINYIFMISCVIISVAFKTTKKISHAYGIAVVCDMMITTSLVTLIMLIIWKKRIWKIALFFLAFDCTEALYYFSMLYKFTQGGFFPFVLTLFLMMLMGIWHYMYKERYIFELKNKVPSEYLKELTNNPNINCVLGIRFLYFELVKGMPPIFPHFITNISSIHSVIVFVSIKSIPISKVALGERFLFRQVEPRGQQMFYCVVRYGYNDLIEGPEEFESLLVEHLKDFIQQTSLKLKIRGTTTEQIHTNDNEMESAIDDSNSTSNQTIPTSSHDEQRVEDKIEYVEKAMKIGMVYFLEEVDVMAEPKSTIFNKKIVNYAYNILRKIFHQEDKLRTIP